MAGTLRLVMLLGLLAAAPGVQAETCTLKKGFELPLTEEAGQAGITIPATLDGHPLVLKIDTGGATSGLHPGALGDAHVGQAPTAFRNVRGVAMYQKVRVGAVSIGSWTVHDVDFIQWSVSDPAEAARWPNTLGANLLSSWDLEIDPAAGMVRFFAHTDCPDPVYWHHADRAALSFATDDFGLMVVTATLDDRRLRTLVDSGAFDSLISTATATTAFGLPPPSGEEPVRKYTAHRFGVLDLAGLQFRNTPVLIGRMAEHHDPSAVSEDRFDAGIGLLLGWHQLRQLHLYIAYGQHVLFATSIAGDKAAAG